MTRKAISLLALVTALCGGCNARSSQSAPDSAASQWRSAGAERGLPEVETYAPRLDDASRDAWQKPEEVIALLDCRTGATVVDLGTGTGYFVPLLSHAVGEQGRVLGLDIAPATVEWIRNRADEEALHNVEARTIAADDPELERRSADRILVVNTWHHIEAREAYAAKLLPALRRGGMLLIVDFTMDAPMGPPVEKRLTVDTVVRELEAAGFATEVLEESLPYQYVVAGRAR
ncbi:MAG: methyltransferase domain-containing protein [Polyangiales bacterium]